MVVRIRRPSKGAHFIHPLDPAPRTAILASGFRETKLVRIFPQGWNERARRFRPGLHRRSAGTIAERGAGRLAARTGGDRLHLRRRIPAFPRSDRESLWKAFGVPVFEQYPWPQEQSCSPASATRTRACTSYRAAKDSLSNMRYAPAAIRAPRLTRGSRIEELAALLA